MKRRILSIVTVIMLIVMTLPASTPVVMGQGGNNQTATDQTATNSTSF